MTIRVLIADDQSVVRVGLSTILNRWHRDHPASSRTRGQPPAHQLLGQLALCRSCSTVEALTEREERVLLAVARGRTNAEIGAELHIRLSTVKFHIASLMTKLGARNRVEVAMWAYETRRVT
jgi:DNA-binding NarL/FixJ family response regulator